jgi:hypothetical protein
MSARERLPNRRQCESFEFRHAGLAFTLCAGFYSGCSAMVDNARTMLDAALAFAAAGVAHG